ncbi:hypothetical protein U732_3579 [Clostridium argentinense CDC 2741]|uniref:Nucleotidyltransferase domain protein n=1 Tax=Clostridium argentinense CDC 2741 TaxID=1418104 RepID=A0A0C1U7I7_9CLOT|nr:hypothetical protein [Clostridium argentinense]ARC86254.1 hypothetical protein RSJ17_18050 [Clostridium argentinense]KIE47768.1 hypothetical protein U732_3579 [Clostridium argentinense CDC 2741]NFF41194.1 hypothetical protein [Clostridium argentinense]NFP51823.1 hypothetical protein [Clostridium argentinense]NFP73908.1 hypothetical protein [Clostridium argentinense]
MLIDKNSFNNIESFIEHLKKNENIIGIVEYGGRTYTDMAAGGDYDLTVIFDKPVSNNFAGVHFHINGIPIDCMILSKEDFMLDNPLNEFLFVHLNCNILYDKDNITSELLKKIQTTWAAKNKLSDSQISLYRFTFKHILDKLEHRLHDNELYTKYFIYSSVDWFLSCYANIKCWEIGKSKLHLKLIQNKEPILFEIISRLYSESSLEAQFILLKKCAEYMLKDIGGLWRENEVLFHLSPEGKNDEDEQNRLLNILFN